MEIKNLQSVKIGDIYQAFHKAFLNYSPSIETNLREVTTRWLDLGIDFDISYGAFAEGHLVAFVLNKRLREGIYNFSLGVIPLYRNQQLISKIFDRMPLERMILEVVNHNEKAIRLYERLGYRIRRQLFSFDGILRPPVATLQGLTYLVRPYERVVSLKALAKPSLESSSEVLEGERTLHETHVLKRGNDIVAYAHYTPGGIGIREIGALAPSEIYLDQLFLQMKLSNEPLRIMNIDAEATGLIDYLLSRGMRILATQYEMAREGFNLEKYSGDFA